MVRLFFSGCKSAERETKSQIVERENKTSTVTTPEDPLVLIKFIRSDVVGKNTCLLGPFGPRLITYADYTASGRMLGFIEDYVRHVVSPLYANTHTEATATGLQTTHFREESRNIIMRSLNAPKPEYACLFCGTGSTGGISKIIDCLGIRIPAALEDRFSLSSRIPEHEIPVVFVGPYEHHSNEVMWRETIATVVVISENSDGNADLELLERALVAYKSRKTKIGSFSAGSNVSGICADVQAVTTMLHKHGALSFWDYAGAGPYVKIDLQSTATPAESGMSGGIDGVFLSPHKFIGGPGSCGVLVARRSIFNNRVPAVPGGGTVAWVTPGSHAYDPHIEHREEGGTPGIIQAIRCGLAFQLKERVGCDTIEATEQKYSMRALQSWAKHPNIHLVGSDRGAYWSPNRLSIISFNIRYQHRRQPQKNSRDDTAPDANGSAPQLQILHQHFVVAVLNDLYGIQARSGCSCAGPYGHRLLDITEEKSQQVVEALTVSGSEAIKPGWARVNFNYFLSDDEVDYIIQAVHQVAEHGWKLLPLYAMDPKSGQWHARSKFADGGDSTGAPLSLGDVRFGSSKQSRSGRLRMHFSTPATIGKRASTRMASRKSDESFKANYASYLAQAMKMYTNTENAVGMSPSTLPDFVHQGKFITTKRDQDQVFPHAAREVRFFPLSSDILSRGVHSPLTSKVQIDHGIHEEGTCAP
jgi:selenocysteine lyase/cysteine desulfurase